MGFRCSLLIIFLVLATNIKTQPLDEYLQTINKAEFYYKQKDYVNASNTFSQAFDLLEDNYGNFHNEIQYFLAARSSIALGKFREALSYLHKSVKLGFIELEFLENRETFKELKIQYPDAWNELIQKVRMNKLKFGEIRQELIDAKSKDQALRLSIGCLIDSHGVNSKEVKVIKGLMAEIDSANEKLLMEVIAKYGWLDRSHLGRDAFRSFWLLIQHNSDELQEQFLPFVKKSVENGSLQGSKYALMYDRIEVGKGNKQLYGSQIRNMEDGSQILFPIVDVKNVNKRRAKYGMEPIEDYLEKYFTIDYEMFLKNSLEDEKK